MAFLLQLNLQSDSAKTETENLLKPERAEVRPLVVGKRLNRMINKAAHKAATEFGPSRSGIFSK
jgi:hypothetical protein